MIRRTDLRQTGVLVVELKDGKELKLPLFEKDIVYEAYELLKNKSIEKVKELYRFEIGTNGLNSLRKDVLDIIKNGIKTKEEGISNYL